MEQEGRGSREDTRSGSASRVEARREARDGGRATGGAALPPFSVLQEHSTAKFTAKADLITTTAYGREVPRLSRTTRWIVGRSLQSARGAVELR